MHRIQTVFYKSNNIPDRTDFERRLLGILDKKFPKKKSANLPASFPGGVAAEKKELSQTERLTVRSILESFKHSVESRAVDSFWKSRRKGKLVAGPEKNGQSLLAMFLQGVLVGRSGFALNEVSSGVGRIDVLLVFSFTPHVVELKILRGSSTPGVGQLGTYMRHENRREGWLVLFDIRDSTRRTGIPPTIPIREGTVRTVVIDVNPIPPSRRKS